MLLFLDGAFAQDEANEDALMTDKDIADAILANEEHPPVKHEQ